MTCSTASNSGKFAWSGVGIGEGTTLKGISFRLSDFFPIKGYSMNPVSLLPNLVNIKTTNITRMFVFFTRDMIVLLLLSRYAVHEASSKECHTREDIKACTVTY
jgi:hypothetical protein